jgi:hypothetical protein
MSDPDGSRTLSLSRALTAARLRAQDYLWSEMARLGLRRDDGWTIVEFTREARGGTQIVMRPMHLHLPSPEGVECVVAIVEDTAGIQTHCSGPGGADAAVPAA